MTNKNNNLLVPIFAGSLACLAYEIALTRIFSISFSYHFAFIVISVAMLGIGASGTLLTVYPKCKDLRFIPLYALFLGVTIPCSYLLANSIPFDPARLAWDRMQILYIGLYSVVLSVPFLCFGLIVSSVFANMSSRSGYVYAVDLAGASTGSLVILLLLVRSGPEQAILLLSLLPLLSVFYFPGRALKIVSLMVIVTNGLLLFMGPDFMHPRISPYKPLSIALKFPSAELLKTYHSPYSRVDIFSSPAVRSAPGLSFRYTGDLPLQLGVSVDAGDIHAITREQDRGPLRFIDYLPSNLAYLVSKNEEVLVIDPKGGLAVLTARRHGSKKVYAVESDPLVMQAVQEQTQRPGTTLSSDRAWSGLGRAWLASRKNTFDVIDLSAMGTMPGWAFGFAEDYRFTVEAFQEYLVHLKPDGLLSLNLFIVPPPRAELRLLAIIATALESHGVKDMSKHIAAIRSWGTLTVIVKRSELVSSDIEKIKKFSQDMRFDLVYYPGIQERESNRYVKMTGNQYFEAFQHLIDRRERQQFIQEYLFDIRPVYDENPFFHYFLRMKNLGEIYRVMGEKWQFFIEEGYLLPVLLIHMVVVSMALIFLPVFRLTRRPAAKTGSGLVLTLIYFSALGMGFMFVEISLIQKMILPLEHPPYAMSTVILGILIGSGVGSFLSERIPWMKHPRTILVLSGIIVLSSLILPEIVRSVITLALPIKSILVVIITSLIGVLMGIPFPLGLSFLETFDQRLIPWAWAVNGCFSVLAPVAAIMIAVSSGFSTVLLLGALMYLGAFIALTMLRKRAAQS
jgi:hypothetical protein